MVERINIIRLLQNMKSNSKKIFGSIGKIRKSNGYSTCNDMRDRCARRELLVGVTLA
jgi:hypothetical protein